MTADKQPVAEATPRTDVAMFEAFIEEGPNHEMMPVQVVGVEHMRKLERELAAAQEKIQEAAIDWLLENEAKELAQKELAAAQAALKNCEAQYQHAMGAYIKSVNRVEDAEAALKKANESKEFYKRRCDELQFAQSNMRDPERTMVCDILANGHLLSVGAGDRYKLSRFTAPSEGLVEELETGHDNGCSGDDAWCSCSRRLRLKAADALRGAEAKAASAWHEAIDDAADLSQFGHDCKGRLCDCRAEIGRAIRTLTRRK